MRLWLWVPALQGQVNHALGLRSSLAAPSLSPTPHPAITERRAAWEIPPHWHLCPSSRTYFRAPAPMSVRAAFSGASKLMNESETRAAGPEVSAIISCFTADCWCYAHFSLQRCLFSLSPSVFYWGILKIFMLDLAAPFSLWVDVCWSPLVRGKSWHHKT